VRVPSQRNRDADLNGDAMTPMIDVVFLLLVFFVCASVGQAPEVLLPAELGVGATGVNVPPPDEIEDEHQEVRIGMTPGMAADTVHLTLNERTIASTAELRKRLIRLAEADPRSRIILVIDDDVSVQQGISVMDLCDSLHFEDVSFGVPNQPDGA